MGYKIDNEMFKNHSWYFRNALVRYVYKNNEGVMYEPKYLERFFRNLLFGEQWVLKNRYLIINPPAEYAKQPRLDVPTSTEQVPPQVPDKLGKDIAETLEKLGKRAEKLGKRLGKNRIAILKMMYENPFVSTIEMSSHIGISTTAIDNNIRQMRNIFIKHIGPKNGGHWEIIMEDNV